MGLMGLFTLIYCGMFLLLPETAIRLGNEPWGFFLNLFGFFCFIGGWGIFLHLLRHEWKYLRIFAIDAVIFEIVAFAASPAAHAFVLTEINRYLTLCAGFFGPVAGSLYVLWLVLKPRKTVAGV